jgi:integrase
MTRATPNRRRLTDGFLRKLKPQQRSFLIHDNYQRGLAIRVEPTGSKSWVCIYNFQRRSRWYLIGKADAIDLAGARKLAGRVMFKVAEGQDPQAERRAERSSGTFEDLARRYVGYAKKKNKSWKQADDLIESYVLKKWGKLQAASVTRGDAKALMAGISSPTTANQVLASASAIFSWAIREEVGGVKVNPCHGIERNKTKNRERVLSDSEVPLFWKAFDEADDPIRGMALKAILLLGQRPGEVANMRTEHVVDGCSVSGRRSTN